MRDKVIGVYNRSVILTYVGILSSFTGIGFLIYRADIRHAVLCLILSGICDLFDGVIARRCKRTEEEKQFGIQIDTLADVISFLMLPAVLLQYLTHTGVISMVIAAFYILCGVSRLGWFNITTEKNQGFFQGLPVTYTALIVPVYYILTLFINGFSFEYVSCAVYMGLAIFYVLNIRIPKPRGVWYVIFPLIAVVSIVVLIVR